MLLRYGYVLITAVLLYAAGPLYAEGLEGLFTPREFKPSFSGEVSGSASNTRKIKNTGEETGFSEFTIAFEAMIVRAESWDLQIAAEFNLVRLDDTATRLSRTLNRSELVLQSTFDTGWEWAPMLFAWAGIGTENDTEDLDADGLFGELIVGLEIPLSDSWTLWPGVFWSPNATGSPSVPLPALQATYLPLDGDLQLVLGLPFNIVRAELFDVVEFQLTAFLWQDFEIEFVEEIDDGWYLKQQAYREEDGWLLTDDAVYPSGKAELQRIAMGVGAAIGWEGENFAIELGYRYEWMSEFTVEDDEIKLGPKLELDDGHYIDLTLSYSFR